MAISLKHSFASGKADGTDTTLVQPSNWNAEHVLTMATARLLGRTTAATGTAEEISVGSNLSLSGLSLNLASSVSITALTASGAISGGSLSVTGTTTLAGAVNMTSTGAAKLPVGTTAQRTAGAQGEVRYNTTLGTFEGYNGTAWGTLTTIGSGGAQAFDQDLADIAGITRARGDIIRGGASGWEKVALGASGQVLTSDGTDAVWGPSIAPITWAAVQATTSGSAVDFTGIPATATEIVIAFYGVSLSGADNILVQLGTSGGPETTGYSQFSVGPNSGGSSVATGFSVYMAAASNAARGTMSLWNVGSDKWVQSHAVASSNAGTGGVVGGGNKTLAATLTQVRITREGATTFDAGSVQVGYR